MDYRHSQTSLTAILVAVGSVILLGVIVITGDVDQRQQLLTAAIMFLIVGVSAVFNRLTVVVAEGVVVASFGFGWPKRVMEVRDIVAVRRVRNQWYYGWGMRKVPGGWTYNVWGLDAVELELRSGSKFRIGTDEPADLLAAISLHASLRPDGA